MTTLVLNHPQSQVIANKKKSFASTFSSGVGEGYYIPQKLISGLNPGDNVVILSDKRGMEERAEGILDKFVVSGQTDHNPPRPRYDVYILDLKKVKFHRRDFGNLERSGIAVF